MHTPRLLVGLALAMAVVAILLWRHDRGIAGVFVLTACGLYWEARRSKRGYPWKRRR